MPADADPVAAADTPRAIARNTALLAATQGVSAALRVVYLVVAARLLGPELYALLAWVQSWTLAFLPLALAGLGPALVQRMAVPGAAALRFAAAGLALRLAATAAAGAACLALAFGFAPDGDAPGLVAVLLAALAGRALTAWAQHLFLVHDLNRHTLRQEAGFRSLEMAAALAVLAAGGGVAALVLLHAASWVAQALAGLRVVRRRIAPLAPAWLAPEVRSLAALALPFLCLQLLAEWRIHGPLILYRGVTEAATFGQFALAMQAMLIVSALPQALGAAAQPALVRAFAARDGRDLAYARLLHRYAFVGGTLAGLLGMALGPLVFGALLGETYAPAGQLVGLAMWCLVPITAGFGLPLVYTLRGEMRSQITLSALATLATALLVPLLGARYGSHGAVVGAALGFSVPPFVSALLAVRRGDGGLGELLLFPLLGSGATVLFYRVFEAYSPWLALAAGCLALAVFMTTLGLVRRHDFR